MLFILVRISAATALCSSTALAIMVFISLIAETEPEIDASDSAAFSTLSELAYALFYAPSMTFTAFAAPSCRHRIMS